MIERVPMFFRRLRTRRLFIALIGMSPRSKMGIRTYLKYREQARIEGESCDMMRVCKCCGQTDYELFGGFTIDELRAYRKLPETTEGERNLLAPIAEN